ncbi:Cytoskeleton-associated protein 2 [Manis javanica]|nr:Cytoskeleton-associated protein 2 [Manis javanica]
MWYFKTEKDQDNTTKDPSNDVKTPNTETRTGCLIKYNVSTTPCLQRVRVSPYNVEGLSAGIKTGLLARPAPDPPAAAVQRAPWTADA